MCTGVAFCPRVVSWWSLYLPQNGHQAVSQIHINHLPASRAREEDEDGGSDDGPLLPRARGELLGHARHRDPGCDRVLGVERRAPAPGPAAAHCTTPHGETGAVTAPLCFQLNMSGFIIYLLFPFSEHVSYN